MFSLPQMYIFKINDLSILEKKVLKRETLHMKTLLFMNRSIYIWVYFFFHDTFRKQLFLIFCLFTSVDFSKIHHGCH